MADLKNTSVTNEMLQSAQNLERKYNIPTSVTIAQLLLEGGTGELSTLASPPYYNLFGVRKGSWKGETVTMKDRMDGTTAEWRVYNSYDEAMEDRGKLLANSRYTQYTQYATNSSEYAKAIQQGGYATDPNYASKLIKIINDYNLEQYNVGYGNTNTTNSISDIAIQTDNKSDEYSGGLLNWKDKAYELLGNIIYFLALIGIGWFGIILFLKAFDVNIKSPKKAIMENVVGGV